MVGQRSGVVRGEGWRERGSEERVQSAHGGKGAVAALYNMTEAWARGECAI